MTPRAERARAIVEAHDPGTVHGVVPAWLGPGAAEARGLAKFLDHTLLAPDATAAHVRQVAAEGRALGVAGVCVDGSWTRLVRGERSIAVGHGLFVVGFVAPLIAVGVLQESENAFMAFYAASFVAVPLSLLLWGIGLYLVSTAERWP